MSEEEEVLKAFRVLDREKTGSIEADELKHLMMNVGGMSKSEFEAMHQDAGGDSQIDYKDFVKDMMAKAGK